MRLFHQKKTAAAIMIQKSFKSFKIKKIYQPLIQKNVSESLHNQLLRRQTLMVQERNKKKAAVKKIES